MSIETGCTEGIKLLCSANLAHDSHFCC